MIWITQGRGGWVLWSLLLGIVLLVAADWAFGFMRPQQDIWLLSLPFGAAGLASIALGLHARRSQPRLVLEQDTGRELMRQPVHSLYGIRADYWGLFYLALAVWLATK